MEKKTTGAWIIHHCKKLQKVDLPNQDYDQTVLAGKCGILLNAIVGTDQADISNKRLEALAKANWVSVKLELPSVLKELEKQRLIDIGKTGISALGLTTTQTLEHTAAIFEQSSPVPCEIGAIFVSEKASFLPISQEDTEGYLADTLHMSGKDVKEILRQYEEIGFIDFEDLGGEKIYFNGNLFRTENMTKVGAISSSLMPSDREKVTEFFVRLKGVGCISKQEAISMLGREIYSKLCSIAFLDENSIGNERGIFSFITQPAAFCKFTNSMIDDAFDLAKAFVTSLTYGITTSPSGRGRIRMIEALMNRLIAGSWIGPATAIGQDYKVLEMRGVVELKHYNRGMFWMRLLKKEIGQLALKVITEGEASTEALLQLPGVSATKYLAPEENRIVTRKKQTEPLKKGVARLLSDLRTGGIR